MATVAPKKIYAQGKHVPKGNFPENLPEFLIRRCNPLILQYYTLCEVNRLKLATCSHPAPPPEPLLRDRHAKGFGGSDSPCPNFQGW